MQFKLASLSALFALSTLAVATPATSNTVPASQCTGSTGSIQCCDSVVPASDATASKLLGLLGVVIQDLTVAIGITCSPILLSGTSCNSQTVCCQDASFNGIIAVGCNPVNINL